VSEAEHGFIVFFPVRPVVETVRQTRAEVWFGKEDPLERGMYPDSGAGRYFIEKTAFVHLAVPVKIQTVFTQFFMFANIFPNVKVSIIGVQVDEDFTKEIIVHVHHIAFYGHVDAAGRYDKSFLYRFVRK
jgi:hypothetical protein